MFLFKSKRCILMIIHHRADGKGLMDAKPLPINIKRNLAEGRNIFLSHNVNLLEEILSAPDFNPTRPRRHDKGLLWPVFCQTDIVTATVPIQEVIAVLSVPPDK